MKQPTSSTPLTFVYGVESGILEVQTLTAIECLRKFGGKYSNAPVIAITPRLGPSLTHQTLRRFEELGVTYIHRNMQHPNDWYPYTNKALACYLAEEEYVKTESIAFLDSDTLVLQEPELLDLSEGTDFAICSTDQNVGTSGPNDKNEPYWVALSQVYGINIDDLPWVVTSLEQRPVRFRVHSGVFSFRRGSGLGKSYLECCEKFLDSGVAYTKKLALPGDSVPLAFAAVKLKLQYEILPETYNYQITPISRRYKRDTIPNVSILHYHKTPASPEGCQWMMEELRIARPDLYEWLKERVPFNPKMGGLHRMLMRRLLNEIRVKQKDKVLQTCQFYVQADA